MSHVMKSVEEVASLVREGKRLLLAGEEELLTQLPKGNWIAGTVPYFMGDQGGLCTRSQVYVDQVPEEALEVRVQRYDAASLAHVYKDAPERGFSVVIMPLESKTHLDFALRAPEYPAFGRVPLVGWVSGVHLDDLGKKAPAVFDGTTGTRLTEGAVVMHVRLPPGRAADIGIVNILHPGEGDRIVFPAAGFLGEEVLINGRKQNLAAYFTQHQLDTRLPLTADYYGTTINIGIKKVDAEHGRVELWAPVFPGIEYRHAAPVGDYVEAFQSAQPPAGTPIKFACNCLSNYLFGSLEGRKTGTITGPITFGEIAYQLVNQTLVYLTVEDEQRSGG